MGEGTIYINFLKTPEGRPRLSMSAAAGAHETSRGKDHVKGETKSSEQDVRLSSRFRVRLYIRYSCLFPMAHLVLFPLTGTARGKRRMGINLKANAFARMFATVTTYRARVHIFFFVYSRPIHISILSAKVARRV